MFIQDNDFECDSAAKWSDPEEIDHPHHFELRFSSDTSFTLPRTSESLLFLAQGSYSYGVIEFTEDDTDSLTSSQIGVYINVRYDNEEALEQAAVCTIVREAGDGIGFFVGCNSSSMHIPTDCKLDSNRKTPWKTSRRA